MMKIAIGKPVHKELSSSFVDLGKLLDELKNNGFSGMVVMIGVRSEAEILLDDGLICNVRIRGEKNALGKNHLGAAMQLVNEENMLISTFQLPPESVIFLSCFLEAERIHENLSSEFTDPMKLINKFQQEGGEYCLEANFQKNIGTGMVFIQDGHVVEAIFSLLGKEVSTGETAVKEIIDGAREIGASFNVYKLKIEDAASRISEPEIGQDELRTLCNSILLQFEKSVKSSAIKTLEYDIFFRESCLTVADQYPFLDPFAAEFIYRDTQLMLHSGETPETLMAGVFHLLQKMLDRLKEEKETFPLDEFKSKLHNDIKKHHGYAFTCLGLSGAINALH